MCACACLMIFADVAFASPVDASLSLGSVDGIVRAIGVPVFQNATAGFRNAGDDYQSLAGVYIWWDYFGKPGPSFASFLRSAVESDTMMGISVVWIYRDLISDAQKPDGVDEVVIIMNQWWMHAVGDSYHFPPPSWVVPIFVSFHVAQLGMLNNTMTVDYLKKWAPIGCRDLATTGILRKRGINAYFSGCLSSQLNLTYASELNTRDPATAFTSSLKSPRSQTLCLNDVKPYFGHVQKALIRYRGRRVVDSSQMQKLPPTKFALMPVLQQYVTMFNSCTEILTTRLHVWFPMKNNRHQSVTLMHPDLGVVWTPGMQDRNARETHRFGGLLQITDLAAFRARLRDDVLGRLRRAFPLRLP
jgi:hypothetical protein